MNNNNNADTNKYNKLPPETNEEHSFSGDDIAEILAEHDFAVTVKNLINKGFNSRGCAITLTHVNNCPRVLLGIENFDTLEVEQFNFSYKEFAQILCKAKDKQIAAYPDTKEEIEIWYSRIIEKLKREDV